jgi:hypothetical protein
VNHTTVTLAIVVAILATFVVGIFVTTTTQSAYAYKKEGHNGDIIGNTIINQKCTENGKVIGSGNSFQQECRPLICTSLSGNAICSASQTGSGMIGRPEPGECEACFNNLTASQKSEFEERLPGQFPGVTTIEQLCTFLRNLVLQGVDPIEAVNNGVGGELDVVGVDPSTRQNITLCVLRAIE